MSILLSTSQRGLACSAGSYFFSSATIALACATGSTAVVERRQIDHMQQQPGALQMAQEQVAQPGAFGSAFDQPGDVGDDEALLGPDAHDAEVADAAS